MLRLIGLAVESESTEDETKNGDPETHRSSSSLSRLIEAQDCTAGTDGDCELRSAIALDPKIPKKVPKGARLLPERRNSTNLRTIE